MTDEMTLTELLDLLLEISDTVGGQRYADNLSRAIWTVERWNKREETAKDSVSSGETLPKLSDLKGIAQSATGELSSEEFVRRLRDEW